MALSIASNGTLFWNFTNTSVTAGVPTGVTTGALVGVAVWQYGGSASTAPTITGFTLGKSDATPVTGFGVSFYSYWFYKYATGADSGTYAVTKQASTATTGYAFLLGGWTGSGNPYVDSLQEAGTASTSITIASFTPGGANSILIALGDTDSSAIPAGWTLNSGTVNGDSDTTVLSNVVQTTAAATGSLVFGANGGAVSIATIRQAAGGTAGTAAGSIALTGAATAKGAATGPGTIALTGAASATASGTAPGSIAVTGAAAGKANSTGPGSVAITGAAAATASGTGPGAISITGAASGVPGYSAAGSIAVTGAATAKAAATGAGAITVTGAANGVAAATAAGAISVVGAAATGGSAGTAAGAVTVTGTAVATAGATTAGAVTITGAANGVAAASAAGSIAVTGAASGASTGTASAAGSITVTGAGAAKGAGSGAGPITITGSASGVAAGVAAGSIAITGAATGAATASATAAGAISVTGGATATATGSAAGSIAVSGSATGTIATGILASYAFDEGTGTTVADKSGNSHPLSFTSGAAAWVVGHSGDALAGISGQLGAVASSLSNPGSNTAIMGWVKPHTVTGAEVPLFGFWSGGDPNGSSEFVLYASRTAFGTSNHLVGNLRVSGTLYEVVGPTLTADTWVHVALTYDGTTANLYVNGSLYASVTHAGSLDAGTLNVAGRTDAIVDDVRVMSSAPSAGTVATLMATPVGGVDGGTVPGVITITGAANGVPGHTAAGIITITGAATGKAGATAAGTIGVSGLAVYSGPPQLFAFGKVSGRIVNLIGDVDTTDIAAVRNNLAKSPAIPPAGAGIKLLWGGSGSAGSQSDSTGPTGTGVVAYSSIISTNTYTVGQYMTFHCGAAGVNQAPEPVVTPGATVTFSFYFKHTHVGGWNVAATWLYETSSGSGFNASGAIGSTVFVPANTWARLSVTGTIPAGKTIAVPGVAAGIGGVTATAGDVLYFDGVLVEAGSAVQPYFDGNSVIPGNSASWVGTPYASVSTDIVTDFNPDAVAATGTVTFTPSPSVQHCTLRGVSEFAAFRPITVPLDGNGYLTWEGQHGVYMVASDSPGLTTPITYRADFNITGASIPSFNFILPTNGALDITTVPRL